MCLLFGAWGINLMRKLFRSFYGKLALALLASFSVVGLLLLMLVERLTLSYENEVEQKLHQDLAYHIIKDHGLLRNGELDHSALKQAFHNMMVLGPAFEFYVIGLDGKIQTYSADPGKVKKTHIDLQPIKAYIDRSEPFPILGDDPRSLSRTKIFSSAEIKHEGVAIGYLYIIIGGEIYDNVADVLKSSHIMKIGFWGFLAALGFILLALMVVFALLTQPLRKLSQDMKLFQAQGFKQGNLPLTQWNPDADEIHRLGTNFNAMALELKAQYEKVKTTDELRKELISYVSHDLRTPLAALLGYLETWQLSNTKLSKADSEHLIQVAIDNGHHISQLVEQLFELARLDSDNVAMEIEPLAIAELAFDVMQNLQGLAKERNVKLAVEPQDSSLIVMADVPKLERVLVNLMENAIRHCEAGDSVTVTLNHKDDDIEVAVVDTGKGIPADELPYICDAHYRARNSVKSKKGNTGLGLAIARKIIQLHASDISVESIEHEGARFSFCLATR